MKVAVALLIGIVVGSVGAALASAGGVSEEVRVAVRSAGSEFVEVGVSQRLADGSWSEVVAPAEATLYARSAGWQFSGGVEIVPEAAATGEIQVRVGPGEIVVIPSARVVSTRCSYASLARHPGRETIWMHALDSAECREWEPPERLLSVRDATVMRRPDDPQYARSNDWLFQLERQAEQIYGSVPVSLDTFEAAIETAYRDFFGDGRTPPQVVHDPSSSSELHDFGMNEIVVSRSELPALSVLDSIAYQLTGRLDSDDWQLDYEWSGPELAAQAIAVFERYLPGFDAEAARASAAEFGVRVAAEPPLPAARRDDLETIRLRRLLGIPREPVLPLLAEEDSGSVTFSVAVEEEQLVARSALGTAVSECGNLGVVRGNRTVWVRPWGAGDCSDNERLFPVGFVQDAEIEEDRNDPQKYRIYDWERQVEANLLPAEMDETISVQRAQAIADAVFADMFGPSHRPPRVRVVDQAHSSYTHQFRQIRLSVAGLNGATVLHETAHAVLAAEADRSFRRWEGHGPEYASTILTFWQRYVPGFDLAQALAAAGLHGVEFAAHLLARQLGVLTTEARAVTAALGLETAVAQGTVAQGDCIYVVQAGDTIYWIANMHGMTREEIVQFNPWLVPTSILVVGSDLRVRCP